MNSKNIVITVLALVLIGAVGYLFMNYSSETVATNEGEPVVETPTTEIEEVDTGDVSIEEEETDMNERGTRTDLGTSVNGEVITAFHFGNGDTEILLIGGVHGSYSPNTSALAEEAVEYFSQNSSLPEGVMLTVIPTLNPDGLAMTGTDGRFNTNDVDLNRNFDCEWSTTGVWRDQEVSGGDEVFSEPEAQALRDYVETYDSDVAIVLFAAEGKVYPSACGKNPSNASIELAATYASAAGYPAAAEFDAYAITGDMVNWMAKQGIPSISVLLTDYQNTEWSKNEAGIKAVLQAYAE